MAGVNVKLFASHSWAVVFFSISLMCQSYSSWLCANSYWIFIKTQTNSNRCASGIALKINLLNSTKLPHNCVLGPHYPSKVILIRMWVNFASSTATFPHSPLRSHVFPHYCNNQNRRTGSCARCWQENQNADPACQMALRRFLLLMKWNILASKSKIELYTWTHEYEYNQLDLAH